MRLKWLDARCPDGKQVITAIMAHVEHAGVHSCDSACFVAAIQSWMRNKRLLRRRPVGNGHGADVGGPDDRAFCDSG